MRQRYPIYTVDAQCQDCYKCVRQCPVKAIKIKDGKAEVLSELCIACGHCVEVCPVQAKKVRQDVGRVKFLLKEKSTVVVSLAPSFRREFTIAEQRCLNGALKQLGFYGVSETALGAEQLTRKLSEELRSDQITGKLLISTACPSATDYICKYLPEFAPYLSTSLSPAQIHGKLLKKQYGENCAVVFIGPCAAKKNESDELHNHIDIALTFTELRSWFDEAGINILSCQENIPYLLADAGYAALYPIEAGMIRTIKSRNINVNYISISGVEEIKKSLHNFNFEMTQSSPRNTFIEVLACKGSCIHGPCMTKTKAPVEAEIEILDRIRIKNNDYANSPLAPLSPFDLEREIEFEKINDDAITDEEIIKTLRLIGKESAKDEINCGGCGYYECRIFAKAIIRGKAEPAMCLSFLKKQAQQKANAIMHHIPAGLVLFDKSMRIIESNAKFAEIFKDELKEIIEVNPSLQQMPINKILPIEETIKQVLAGHGVISNTIHYQKRIYDIIIFSVTPGLVAGGFFQDVTNTEMKHEEISTLAQEVIHKNLQSVQEIACKLGENMAETEILLRTLVRGFASEKIKKYREANSEAENGK